MRCRGGRRTSCSSRRRHVRGSSGVWTRKTVAKVLTENEASLFAFHFFCWEGITFRVLCSPRQKGSLCRAPFCGIKTKQVCKWLWIESFGAVLQKSTCQAGPGAAAIYRTRCQKPFKGLRLDHFQKIKAYLGIITCHNSKHNHMESPSLKYQRWWCWSQNGVLELKNDLLVDGIAAGLMMASTDDDAYIAASHPDATAAC